MQKLVVLFIAIQMISCSTGKKLLQKTEILNAKIKFYSVADEGSKSKIKKIYAEVDSAGHKAFYSFYPNSLLVTTAKFPQTMLTLAYSGAEGYRPFTIQFFDCRTGKQTFHLYGT